MSSSLYVDDRVSGEMPGCICGIGREEERREIECGEEQETVEGERKEKPRRIVASRKRTCLSSSLSSSSSLASLVFDKKKNSKRSIHSFV